MKKVLLMILNLMMLALLLQLAISCSTTSETAAKTETRIEYKVPDVYFPSLPDFVVFYNTVTDANGKESVESVTLTWDDWQIVEQWMYTMEIGVDALYQVPP